MHDVPPSRLALLEALAKACNAAGVHFAWRWPASGHAATDAFIINTVREVEARWQALEVEVAADIPEGPLAWIGQAVFAEDVRTHGWSLASISDHSPPFQYTIGLMHTPQDRHTQAISPNNATDQIGMAQPGLHQMRRKLTQPAPQCEHAAWQISCTVQTQFKQRYFQPAQLFSKRSAGGQRKNLQVIPGRSHRPAQAGQHEFRTPTTKAGDDMGDTHAHPACR